MWRSTGRVDEGGSNAAFFVFGYNPNEMDGGHFLSRKGTIMLRIFTLSHFHATLNVLSRKGTIKHKCMLKDEANEMKRHVRATRKG